MRAMPGVPGVPGVPTELLARKKLAVPRSWANLHKRKREYEGEIQVANPASSGTAYTMIATLVRLTGEDKSFDYLKGLHQLFHIDGTPREAPCAVSFASATA